MLNGKAFPAFTALRARSYHGNIIPTVLVTAETATTYSSTFQLPFSSTFSTPQLTLKSFLSLIHCAMLKSNADKCVISHSSVVSIFFAVPSMVLQ